MNKKLLSLPFIFWSAMFVIVPLCMVFYYGLTDKSGAFTLDNILAIATAEHSKALWEALTFYFYIRCWMLDVELVDR